MVCQVFRRELREEVADEIGDLAEGTLEEEVAAREEVAPCFGRSQGASVVARSPVAVARRDEPLHEAGREEDDVLGWSDPEGKAEEIDLGESEHVDEVEAFTGETVELRLVVGVRLGRYVQVFHEDELASL